MPMPHFAKHFLKEPDIGMKFVLSSNHKCYEIWDSGSYQSETVVLWII